MVHGPPTLQNAHDGVALAAWPDAFVVALVVLCLWLIL
jgi:hypothetical protein